MYRYHGQWEFDCGGAVYDPQPKNDLGVTYWLGILLEIWFLVGTLALVWAARKVIQEEKQISNPDRSFYRRNDSNLFRLIFYFILWCSTGTVLYGLWLHITGHGA